MISAEKILLDSYDYNLISNQRDQYISYTTLTLAGLTDDRPCVSFMMILKDILYISKN